MKNFAEADFYADKELHTDPHAYFDYLRSEHGPVAHMKGARRYCHHRVRGSDRGDARQ